jgi:hypothetical protein
LKKYKSPGSDKIPVELIQVGDETLLSEIYQLINFIWSKQEFADHSGRAVYGMKCLRPLEHWDRGFESHSRHG